LGRMLRSMGTELLHMLKAAIDRKLDLRDSRKCKYIDFPLIEEPS
jgi:hypothetical protein